MPTKNGNESVKEQYLTTYSFKYSAWFFCDSSANKKTNSDTYAAARIVPNLPEKTVPFGHFSTPQRNSEAKKFF
jgi:hypothetical protein